MDEVQLRLECLKLASLKVVGRDPVEIIELAKMLESYCSDSAPCSQSEKIEESVTSEQKPNDSVKVHKNSNSKK